MPDYSATFLKAVNRVLADEGGYVLNSSDPGGETNWGISKRSYPALNIKTLSRDDAIAIYFRDWWQAQRYAALTDMVGAKVFDISVLTGRKEAVVVFQRALQIGRAHV